MERYFTRNQETIPFLNFKDAYKNVILLKYDVDTIENVNMNYRLPVQETNFCPNCIFSDFFAWLFPFLLGLSVLFSLIRSPNKA